MSKLNNTIKLFSALFTILFISACSSTANTTHYNWTDDTISTNNVSVEKKSFSSDHQLLLSLLNRPLPEDQLMMMRFARINEINNSGKAYPTVRYISIRGEQSDNNAESPTFAYSDLIYQDQNSIAIGAPR